MRDSGPLFRLGQVCDAFWLAVGSVYAFLTIAGVLLLLAPFFLLNSFWDSDGRLS